MEALPSEPTAASSASSSSSSSSGHGNDGGSSSNGNAVAGVGRVHLVDFEFAGSNWRSFDLANVLLEAAVDNQVCHRVRVCAFCC
jgi:thiamine kinase-like enzyme